MATLAYFLHGRGRGHAARSLPIARALRALGHQVDLYGGGDAWDLAQVDDCMQACTPVLPGHQVLGTAWRRVREDQARVARADLVISDGDMPSLIAARWRGVPTIAVGHELVFSGCRLPADLPGSALFLQRANTWHSSLLPTRSIAVHFLDIEPARRDVVVARPDLSLLPRPAVVATPTCLAYFRDGNGAGVLRAAVRAGLRVVCYGPAPEPVEGVEHRPFDARRFAEDLRTCRAVLCSSGSNLLAECVQLGKPFLAMYRANDAEQRLNALLCEQAGVAIGAAFDEADSGVQRLAQALRLGSLRAYPLAEALPSVTDTMLHTVEELLALARARQLALHRAPALPQLPQRTALGESVRQM